MFVAVADLRERLTAPVRANIGLLFAVRAEVVVKLGQASQNEALAAIEVAHVQSVVLRCLLGLLEVVNVVVSAFGHVPNETHCGRIKLGSSDDPHLPVGPH